MYLTESLRFHEIQIYLTDRMELVEIYVSVDSPPYVIYSLSTL